MQAAYPHEAIDRRIPFSTTPSFSHTFDYSGDDQKSNVVLLQNNFQTAFPSDVNNTGEVYNAVNGYEQPRTYNTIMSGESGIVRRARPARDEQFKTNPMQGTAQRRIRLSKIEHVSNGTVKVKDESCTQEQHNSKPIIAKVRKVC